MAKTVTVTPGADVDLFWIAAREWGDASAWLAVAEANGTTSADLPAGITVLAVPAWEARFSGGVPG